MFLIFTAIGKDESADDMRVVHLGIGIVPVPPGDIAAGREEYIYHLTNHLGQLGCHVHVIDIKGGTSQQEKRKESSAKFHEACHLSSPYRHNFPFWEPFFNYILNRVPIMFFALSSSLALHRLMSREKIEVVHAHDREIILAAVFMNKLRRNRAVTVYTLHAGYKLEKQSRCQKVLRMSEILALKWTDHIIALTPEVKEWLISEFNLDPVKITPVLGGGAALDEVEQFLAHKVEACHQSNTMLFVGVVQPRKNQFTAVKAMLNVIKVHPEIKLVFAGPTSEAEYLQSIQKYIAENNLSANVEFKGEVSKQELYHLYSDAKLFLFPTTAEIRPAVLIEALAFGLPVISSTIKPIADVVSDKGCAIMVDPYDVDGIAAAINRVLDDNSLRQSMSEKARELARTFSYENIAGQTLDLYKKLVRNKKLTPH